MKLFTSASLAVLATAVIYAGSVGANAQTAAAAKDKYGVLLNAPANTAAVVNGHVFTRAQVEETALREYGGGVCNKMIDDYLTDLEAQKQGITVTPDDLDKYINQVYRTMNLQTLATANGLTLDEYKDQLKHDLLRQELVTPLIKPAKLVHIEDILIRAQPKGAPASVQVRSDAEGYAIATYVLQQAKSGKDFETLAKEYSDNPNDKTSGGDAGIIYDGADMDPAVVAAAVLLKRGDVCDKPVRAGIGYVLVKVVSTADSHPQDEDDAYATALTGYMQQQATKVVPQYMQQLRQKYNVIDYVPN